jgi:hypothetical protein
MPAYQQLGHQAANLLEDARLITYRGAVLSPVNYAPVDLRPICEKAIQRRSSIDLVFDPQLYFPRSNRGQLRTWSYFPSEFDTADANAQEWWDGIVNRLVADANELGCTAICSPAEIPRIYADAYYARVVATGQTLQQAVSGSSIRALQTIVVPLSELAARDRALEIASIASGTCCREIYLVIVGTTDPRRELADAEELKGAMLLIAALQSARLSVFVAFASTDMLLWKAAGASNCGTGKFFNLRRFTVSRFEEPKEGGSALPYWCEEGLVAFLRDSDLLRVRQRGLLSSASQANPFAQEILENLDQKPPNPWIALGWRQYLYWFADAESRVADGELDVSALLKSAEDTWQAIEDAQPPLLMAEPRNSGSWLRQWRRALAEYAA